MKKTLIIFAIMFYVNPHLYSQELLRDTSNFSAVYNFEYQQDSTDLTSKQNEKMELLIGEKYSLFESVNGKYNDSLKKVLGTNKDVSLAISMMIAQKKRSRFNFRILKTNEETLVFDSYFSDKFIYKDEEKLNWEITNTKQEISGYNCTLAKTVFAGREYNAWFTSEIPISDGPYKFKGLPGLIVKIEDVKKQYSFELESFTKTKKNFDFEKNKGIKVSKKEFYTSYKSFKKNFIAQLSHRGIEIDGGASRETQKRVQKSRNNEIEISY